MAYQFKQTIDRININRLSISMPAKGNTVYVSEIVKTSGLILPQPGDQVQIQLDIYNITVTVTNTSEDFDIATITAVAGASPIMSSLPQAKHFKQTSVKDIIEYLVPNIAYAPEERGFTSQAEINDVINFKLKEYQIFNNIPRGLQLSRLLREVGNYTWTCFMGIVQLLPFDPQYEIELPANARVVQLLADGSATFQLSVLDLNAILPKNLIFGGKPVREIQIESTREVIYLTIYTSDASINVTDYIDVNKINPYEELGSSSAALDGCYTATIQSQNADGTVNVTPLDPRIRGGGMENLNIRYGTANLRATDIPKGTQCTIEFDVNNPSRPFVSSFFVGDDYSAVNIFGDPNSAQALARYDDLKTEIDALQKTLDDLITAYNGHIHITTATPGTSPTPGTISPTTSTASTNGPVGAFNTTKIKAE